jgi:hypothetical protein
VKLQFFCLCLDIWLDQGPQALFEVGHGRPDPSPASRTQHVHIPGGRRLEFVPRLEGSEVQGGSKACNVSIPQGGASLGHAGAVRERGRAKKERTLSVCDLTSTSFPYLFIGQDGLHDCTFTSCFPHYLFPTPSIERLLKRPVTVGIQDALKYK